MIKRKTNKIGIRILVPIIILGIGASVFFIYKSDGDNIYFSCAADNDLYRVMTSTGKEYQRFSDPNQAIEAAPIGSGVLILADNYPEPTDITPEAYEKAESKDLKLFVEYPSFVPGLKIGSPKDGEVWERAVVATNSFEPELSEFRILQLSDYKVLPIESDGISLKPADLVLARIAGYNKAVYGLPDTTRQLLVEVKERNILLATTKLSQFVTARYGPSSAWEPIWNNVLAWLSRSSNVTLPKWTPTVRTSFTKDEELPENAEIHALQRGLKWYKGFLLDEPWLVKSNKLGWERIGGSPVIPARKPDEPYGDGSFGVLEGHISYIMSDGSQPRRNLPRADCNAETAMSYALGSLTENNQEYSKISLNIMDYLFKTSGMFQGPPTKPSDGWFGFFGWYEGGSDYGNGIDLYWGNDNSKALIGTMVTAAALKTDQWDENLLAGILTNFRTSGPEGFRNGIALRKHQLQEKGWEYYAKNRMILPWPQREAWAWANYLWLYDKTNYKPLLEHARSAIRLTMEKYPDNWLVALHQLQMERGRMLLPLAWLVRVDDTPEHRRWLYQVIDDMIERMDESGAIQEEMIATSLTSNEDYGGSEASIVHLDGDPCVDVFYAMAPAFLGMHEAVVATDDQRLKELTNKMAEFLVRIQLRSEKHEDIDGGWFRAFDYINWDYWGANGDTGWGAWCSETGWLQSHVVATLAARKLKTSLWDLTSESDIARNFDRYRREMQIDKAVDIWKNSPPLDIAHIGMSVVPELSQQPSRRHPGNGAEGLVDGLFGPANHSNDRWYGFPNSTMEAVVDIRTNSIAHYIGARFLHDEQNGIYFPKQLEALAFQEEEWKVVGKIDIEEPENKQSPVAKEFGIKLDDIMTPELKLRIVNRPAAKDPGPTYMFMDELITH
ncbi:MAG: hypothetical protein DHS20C17_00750 [Cyclobacteriaceae bacterium]|nr:MAG: hypothetical protein DHS20C17_00750 [Cyclobacteriaceae bacterium]